MGAGGPGLVPLAPRFSPRGLRASLSGRVSGCRSPAAPLRLPRGTPRRAAWLGADLQCRGAPRHPLNPLPPPPALPTPPGACVPHGCVMPRELPLSSLHALLTGRLGGGVGSSALFSTGPASVPSLRIVSLLSPPRVEVSGLWK